METVTTIPVATEVPAFDAREEESEAPILKLCRVQKWPFFQGFGFNLYDEKGKPGHYIGNVDSDSPAEAAGLRVGDKIIEVNGQSIFTDDHYEVVRKITSDSTKVDILLADTQADQYYRSRNIWPHQDMPNIRVFESPVPGVEQGKGGVPDHLNIRLTRATVAPASRQCNSGGDTAIYSVLPVRLLLSHICFINPITAQRVSLHDASLFGVGFYPSPLKHDMPSVCVVRNLRLCLVCFSNSVGFYGHLIPPWILMTMQPLS